MPVEIKSIAYYLPEQVLTNEQLKEENTAWDMDFSETRAGVFKRHIADQEQTALDLAYFACQKLFLANPELHSVIDWIIFCTQSPDHVMPPNSCILHGKLDLPDNVFTFDFNLACSGYIYGLALAQGLVDSGFASNILLVTADTYSKYIDVRDRATKVLFGDAAAVSWIAKSTPPRGIIDIQCTTSGNGHEKSIIPAGGCRIPSSDQTKVSKPDSIGNYRSLENIHMDGMGVLAFVNTKVPPQIRDILTRNKFTIEDIDLFLFHQASRLALDSLTRLLKIEPAQVFSNLKELGNTVSASIPIAWKQAWDSGRIKSGDTVLLSGFGVGLSCGTAIIKA
jgi:3-oxoacyl-[acyl-carrier-protein] synthase-3